MQNYLDYKMEEPLLFQTRFDDGLVVWKPLPWCDYKKYRDARHRLGPSIDIQVEEDVFNRCVIYSTFDIPAPTSLNDEERRLWVKDCRDDQKAGVIATVVKSILAKSGALTGKGIIRQLDEQRPLIDSIEDQLVVLVCKAFPAYTPEQVESLPWEVFLRRVAQAESVLGHEVQLVDKEAEERKRQQEVFRQMENDARQFNKIDPHNATDEELQVLAQRQQAAQRAAKLRDLALKGQLRNLKEEHQGI